MSDIWDPAYSPQDLRPVADGAVAGAAATTSMAAAAVESHTKFICLFEYS